MTGNNHLCNALTIVDDKILLRQVDQHNTNLATVVGIDGTRSIQHRQTVLQCQSTTWTHLCLITFRQSDVETSRYQSTFHGVQGDGGIKVSTQIHTGTL